MAFTIIRPADRNGWLQQREKGIGSSEVATILGKNPFETPYQLWLRKTGQAPAKEPNEAMRAGTILEGAVARYYEEETGRKVIKASAGDWLAVDTTRPFLRVSPDRTYWLEGKHTRDNKGILECKTTQLDVADGEIPEHWFCQLTYQLGVMGYRQGSLAWLTRGRKFGTCDIMFDADVYRYMVERIEKFWVDCVLGGQEPDVVTVEDSALKFPRSVDKSVEVSNELMNDINILKALKPQIDELSRQKKEIEDRVKIYMEDADALCLPGTREQNPVIIATYKSPKDSSKFDEKRFAKEHADLYEQYQVTKPGARRFLLK